MGKRKTAGNGDEIKQSTLKKPRRKPPASSEASPVTTPQSLTDLPQEVLPAQNDPLATRSSRQRVPPTKGEIETIIKYLQEKNKELNHEIV